jgi:glucose-6-phosphate 1-dehydrogenase
MQKTAEPCVVVIFGASGDLTKRKLVPEAYRLVQERLARSCDCGNGLQ